MGYIIGTYMKWNIGLHNIPWNKNFNEFTQPNKTISKETKASYQGKNNGNIMRSSNAFSFQAKPRSKPGRAGISIGAPQPFGQKHHIKNLVKNRPKQGNPNAFKPINKTQRHHPHGAADIKHIRSIAKPKQIPWQFFACQQITFLCFPCLL